MEFWSTSATQAQLHVIELHTCCVCYHRRQNPRPEGHDCLYHDGLEPDRLTAEDACTVTPREGSARPVRGRVREEPNGGQSVRTSRLNAATMTTPTELVHTVWSVTGTVPFELRSARGSASPSGTANRANGGKCTDTT